MSKVVALQEVRRKRTLKKYMGGVLLDPVPMLSQLTQQREVADAKVVRIEHEMKILRLMLEQKHLTETTKHVVATTKATMQETRALLTQLRATLRKL